MSRWGMDDSGSQPTRRVVVHFLGAGIVGVNEKQYEVNKGDLVIVEPNEAHWVKSGETPLQIVVFKLPNIPEDKTLATNSQDC